MNALEELNNTAVILGYYLLLLTGCVVFALPLNKREKPRRHWMLGIGFWILAALLAERSGRRIANTSGWLGVCSYFMCAGFLAIVCRQKPVGYFYAAVWVVILDQTMLYVWNGLYIMLRVGGSGEGVWRLIYPWLLTGNLIFGLTFARLLPKNGRYNPGPRQICLALLTGFAQQAVFTYSLFINNKPGITQYFMYVAIQILCITLLFLEKTMFEKSALNHELEIMQLLWQQQKEQYALNRENISLINQKCHDLKHQIAALRSMGDSVERSRYIQELQQSVGIYDSVVRTGNEALDTVLTEKSLYCEANGITVNCVADGKNMGFIDIVDLYAIMGNALDNAIEGVEKIKNPDWRVIDVLVYVRQNFLVINIMNPIEHELQFEDNLPLTTKERDGRHGFGLKSIRHTAEKYGGHMSCTVEGGCFNLKILFPVRK